MGLIFAFYLLVVFYLTGYIRWIKIDKWLLFITLIGFIMYTIGWGIHYLYRKGAVFSKRKIEQYMDAKIRSKTKKKLILWGLFIVLLILSYALYGFFNWLLGRIL